jgi:hypothetical protein
MASPGQDFDDAVLGHGLAPAAEAALREAGLRRADPPAAMAALMRARALAPDHPAVLIAFYRHHFYGHQFAAARAVARHAMAVGAQALGLPTLWRDVPACALAGAAGDPGTRFYLFVLKGYAYLSLRLGDGTEARDALALLRHLDPNDHVGGAVLEAVRQRAAHDPGESAADDDEPGPALTASGAAAWAQVTGAAP